MKTNFEEYVATELAPNFAAHEKPGIFLLTCIDYRYAHRIIDLMDSKGLRRKYDVFSLAGAAAGGNQIQEWSDVFVQHIEVARDIKHPIERVIILEHRDCGAYTKFFGLEWDKVTPPYEAEKHQEQVQELAAKLYAHFREPAHLPVSIDAFLLARDEDDPLPIHEP